MNSSPSAWNAFAPHAGRPYAFFLDRADRHAPSFAGSAPSSLLWIDRNGISRVWRRGKWRSAPGDPLRAISEFVADSEADPKTILPPFLDRAVLPRTVGYLSYDIGRWIERVAAPKRDSLGLGLALLCSYDHVEAWDDADARPVRIEFDVRDSEPCAPRIRHTPPLADAETPTPEQLHSIYRAGFGRIKRAIADGEVYQVNLSRRIATAQQSTSEAVFARMRSEQAVPQGAFFDAGLFQLMSNSPETFLQIDGSEIRTFPIKGTRPRSIDEREDRRLLRELECNDKERAEHLMIVDLERNDLGRVCETGSVSVPSFCKAQSFASVHHMVSEVRGRLRNEVGLDDILRATFPGGSITGAPKIKAMQIIAEIEPESRGPYTGAIGCFNGGRRLDLNVAIRTAFSMDGKLYYSTGGGIVADSSVEAEYAETVTKAQVFVRAARGEDATMKAPAS